MKININIEDLIQIVIALISAAALVVSIVAIVLTYKQNKNDKRFQNKVKYFDNIFLDYLIKDIPQAKMYLRFDNNKLTDESDLIDALTEMKRKALYYKIVESDFYTQLKNEIEGIEDYIANSKNKEIIQDEQAEFWVKFNDKLEHLYKVIDDYIF